MLNKNSDQASPRRNGMRRQIDMREFGTLFVLIGICIILALLNGKTFLSGSNIENVSKQVTMNALLAAGMTIVLLIGAIDLSVGSNAAICGVVTAMLLTSGVNIALSIFLGVLLGALIGLVNGLIITKMKIPFFIVTLATMVITRGIGFLITGGLPVAYFPDAFQAIGKGHFLGVPISVVIVIVIYIIFFVVLNYTKFGRYIYAIGGNEEAVRLSGINVNIYKTSAYVLSGMMASMAGIVLASRLNSGQPTACDGWEMDAIAAVVIGGTKLSGGDGKIQMTLVGALILGVLSNGLNIMKVSSYWQFVLKGLVILIAVGFSMTNWVARKKAAQPKAA